MTREKAAWEASKAKDDAAFSKLAAPEYHSVYARGIRNLAAELAAMKALDMASFSISDFKTASPHPDTAITAYKVKMDSSLGGEKYSSTMNSGSVWKKMNGEWHVLFHTSIDAEPAKETTEKPSEKK